MPRLRQIALALALGACAQTYTPPEIAPTPAPPLSSCGGVDDMPLCFLRLGMTDPASYDQRDYGTFLELPDPAEIPPIRAALAFGLDIASSEDGRVAVERALMEALRLDAAGAAPEAALAPIAALPDTSRPSMEPGSVQYRAYVDLARWISPFARNRPSPALARLALQRAEQLAMADPQIEARPNFTANIADAYGVAGLSEEGLAFVRRSERAHEPGVIALTGALDAAEAAAMAAQDAECPSASRADNLSTIAFHAQLRGDAAREAHLLNASLDETVMALTACPSATILFPALWRLAALESPDAARRAAQRLEPFATHWDALQAQRNIYETLKDDAQICRIANQQAALPTLTGDVSFYVVEGQTYCAPALQAWQDASLPEDIRLRRGIDAGVPIYELERFALHFEDGQAYTVQGAAGRLLEDGRVEEAELLAELYVGMDVQSGIEGLSNPAGDPAWRVLMHHVIAPNLYDLLMMRSLEEFPTTNPNRPANADDQQRARRAAAAVLEYELEAGLRTLPN